jgi:hypothetical protein
LSDGLTLPAAFSSILRGTPSRGCILANDEFYVVFEANPLMYKQVMQHMKHKRFEEEPIKYLYVAAVFYRNSRNPHGPTHRPIYTFCLEYTEFTCTMKPQGFWASLTGRPAEPADLFYSMFFSGGRLNMARVTNNFSEASALEHLMEGVCRRLAVDRRSFWEIGPLSLGASCPQIA